MHKFGNVGSKLTLLLALVAGLVCAMPTKEELKAARSPTCPSPTWPPTPRPQGVVIVV